MLCTVGSLESLDSFDVHHSCRGYKYEILTILLGIDPQIAYKYSLQLELKKKIENG